MARFCEKSPCQNGLGRNRTISAATIQANTARIPYSRRMNVLAPALMSADTSMMRAFPSFCLRTHKNR